MSFAVKNEENLTSYFCWHVGHLDNGSMIWLGHLDNDSMIWLGHLDNDSMIWPSHLDSQWYDYVN